MSNTASHALADAARTLPGVPHTGMQATVRTAVSWPTCRVTLSPEEWTWLLGIPAPAAPSGHSASPARS